MIVQNYNKAVSFYIHRKEGKEINHILNYTFIVEQKP